MRHWGLLTPALLAISLLVLVPLAFIGVYSFWLRLPNGAVQQTFSLLAWEEFFFDSYYIEILWRTIKVAAITTIICAILGYPPAYFLANTRSRHRLLLLLLLMLPFWISFIIRTMSWLHILGTSGAVNSALQWLGLIDLPIRLLYTDWSIYFGLVHFMLPFMILNIYISLDSIDRNLVAAARTLGAGEWQSFREITLPLSLPGLAAGSLLCFVLTCGTYITPLLLGGPGSTLFASLIFETMLSHLDWPFGAVLSFVLILFLGSVVLIYNRYLGLTQVFKSFAR